LAADIKVIAVAVPTLNKYFSLKNQILEKRAP
jgi:hypothetical protein